MRDILDLAEYVEAGPADPEHVACKAEEFIDVVEVISALSDQDVDRRVTANLEEVLRRFSGTRVQQEHTQGPGRLAYRGKFWNITFFVDYQPVKLQRCSECRALFL